MDKTEKELMNEKFKEIVYRGIQWKYAEENHDDITIEEIKGDPDLWEDYFNEDCMEVFENQNPEWKIVYVKDETGEQYDRFEDIPNQDDPEEYYLDIAKRGK